ncbi:MAG TPA: PAS domain S-box protein [Methylophilaceae bacterium]|nr:PAS domain S-box protein [Methylophilaceae bacterium]
MKTKLVRYLKPHFAFSVTAIYLVAGVFWVFINDSLYNFSFVRRGLTPSTLISLGFILVSAGLLYLLLKRWRNAHQESVPAFTASAPAPYLFGILIALLLVVPSINYAVMYLYGPKIERDAYENLRIIAKIKAVQLERWLEFRNGDAEVVAADKTFAALTDAMLRRNEATARQRIGERFDALMAAYKFEGVSLIDHNGEVVLHRGTRTIESTELRRELMEWAASTGKVQRSDLYLASSHTIQMDVIAPIRLQTGKRNQVIAYVMIHTGLQRYVLPRLQAWPNGSPTAEAMLVRQENGVETFVNTVPRDRSIPPLLSRPYRTDSPYSISSALQKGLSYKGTSVFTAQERIDTSNWRLVTQIDQEEVMAPLGTLLLWISAISLAAIFLIAAALLLLWRQQRQVYLLQLINQSTKHERLLQRFFDLPFIGMGICDPATGRWSQVNDRLCQILGYMREELLELTWSEITHSEDLEQGLDFYWSCLRGEIQSFSREKRFLHKTGKVLITHIEVSCTRRDDDEIEMFLVMVEDITERKQAEQALQQSEERLALVLKGTNDGWWDIDLLTNTAYHSPRWWTMLGYTPEQDVTEPLMWQQLSHPDDIKPALEFLRKELASNRVSYEVELRLRHRQGHYVPILTRGFILRNQDGLAIRVSGINTDLSERKAAENALKLQEEFNRVLLESQSDGVVACDVNLKLVLFNHTAREWHGVNLLDVPSSRWGEHFGLYDADGLIELEPDQIPLVRAYHGEYVQHAGMTIKANGQGTRYISCSASPFYDTQGKMLGAVAIMRDVTANRQQTQALLESEALYRQMFDANPHPMWVYDLDTLQFLAVNDAAISHYGWSREEFLSMTIADIRPHGEVLRLRQNVPVLIHSGLRFSGEWLHRKKDGTEINVEITSHPLNFSGHVARLVLSYDITERKRGELEVRTLNRLLLVLTNINQALIRRLSPLEIFSEACTIAVRDGGFRMAWVGLVQDDQRSVAAVASAGEVGDYIESLAIDLKGTHAGPTVLAIREGYYAVSHDLTTDEETSPWREKALTNGYRGMVALPIKKFGKVIGNFSLYASEVGTFNARELDLLMELADDISFALEVVEAEDERRLAEKALQESEALFHTLASSSPVGIIRTDLAGNVVYVNDRCRHMAGLAGEKLDANDWAMATHPEDREYVQTEWQNAVSEQRGFSMEYRFQRADGSMTWVKGQAEVEKDLEGNFLGFVGTVTDITAIKTSEENLRMSAAVFENTREGVLVTDPESRIILVNRAFSEISRYDMEETLGQTPKILSSGRHDSIFFSHMWQSLHEIGHWQGEIWNRRKNGDIYPSLMSISAIKNKDGEVINYVGVFADISNLKASEAQLEFLAHHDPLTRLPNRLMLISRLDHAIEVSRRDNSQLALLMLDLDRFKNVNDSFGHLAGDELLQQVAKRLISNLRGVDTVSRLGGDEFTVLLEDVAQPEDAARVAEHIIRAIEAPWKLSNNIEVRIGASIGISLFPGHGSSALELLQHADAALYQAKAAGRGCVRYFSESLTQAARDRFSLEAKLRQAIPNNEFRVYYQPKIEMASGQIVGAEALLRWEHPEQGLVMPARFINIAEDTGLIVGLGEWVLEEACKHGKQWLDAGLPLQSLAVNLSAHQLHHSDIVKTLTTILTETGFPAERLELELTESTLMQREVEIIEILGALQAMGIRLAIDDFGTGYSSLSYLKSFSLDVLKIDKSFVEDIESDQDDRAITATIIGMAHTLGMQVVAEGVETRQQLEFLRSHDCDMYQGFLVSPPLPAEEFCELLSQEIPKKIKTLKA